jgi:hypothetical protein
MLLTIEGIPSLVDKQETTMTTFTTKTRLTRIVLAAAIYIGVLSTIKIILWFFP